VAAAAFPEPTPVQIRALAVRDSLAALTALLHRAYAPLAGQGLNFTAATQTVDTTRQRAAEGQCFVADAGGEVVGTVTVCGPYDVETAPWALDVPWFRDPDTAHFHQFAVDPGWQRRGVGRLLVQACEHWARKRGYLRLALDTAAPAQDLRALYRRLGYADVGQVQWKGKRYASVVMQKALDRSPLRDHLQTLARYNLWATQVLVNHVDALSEHDYRRDAGLFFKSVHGTLNHLLLTEHGAWMRRFAEGVSPMLDLAAEIEPDRLRLRQRLVESALAWLPLLEVWPQERLLGTLAFRRSDGQEAELPFAATLAHVFNHGTHHRGQISAALTAMGHGAPVLDLAAMLQQEARRS
jgi:uncharacterized damage-inducible protein DinB/GNAT superfamily N-acetyltransferase